ncbi:hypothetical protein, partial [Burkholderia stagnalis]
RCTTLSRGGSDLDEIGGLRLGGNQQWQVLRKDQTRPDRRMSEKTAGGAARPGENRKGIRNI